MADWNRSYAEAETRLFGDAPNEYVREVMGRSDFRPRSALCLADGDGRNGAWLASQGVAVTAIDISDVATAQAREHDKGLGVTVERIAADLAEWQPPKETTWDAAFLIFLQCDDASRRTAVERAAAALAPGGWFVAEGFSRKGLDAGTLGPKNADLLYDLDGLIAALPGFRIVEAFEGRIWLNEGKRHQGEGRVARLLARKPD